MINIKTVSLHPKLHPSQNTLVHLHSKDTPEQRKVVGLQQSTKQTCRLRFTSGLILSMQQPAVCTHGVSHSPSQVVAEEKMQQVIRRPDVCPLSTQWLYLEVSAMRATNTCVVNS